MLLTRGLAGDCGIPYDFAREIIVSNHEMKMIPEKKLVKMDLEVDEKTVKAVEKIAKTLNVEIGAIIAAVLEQELEHDRQSRRIIRRQ